MKTSVALCTYNGEKFLVEQLESILAQTHAVDEIVICDDGSTDCTISILNSYQKRYPSLFRIYFNKQKLQSVRNFEKAISLCGNDIVFLSDQDDIWLENKVEKILRVFEERWDISVVCTNGFIIDEKSQLLDKIPIWDFPKIATEQGYIFDYYNILNLVGNFSTGATMAFRREFISCAFPFPIYKGMHHDRWIALVAALKNKFLFFDEKIIGYRLHSAQQVGSVFHENTPEEISWISNYFRIDKEHKSFKEYKKLLRRFAVAYSLNNKLLNEHPHQQKFFVENINELRRRFIALQAEMDEKFPLSAFFLKISDYLLGKRKL